MLILSLILSRRTDATIIIGDDIKFKILSISRTQVKIGIDAPDDVSVHREEVYNRIQKEQQYVKN